MRAVLKLPYSGGLICRSFVLMAAFAFAPDLSGSVQPAPCPSGHVREVTRGRDYVLNVCGIGLVALRGVEPPLRGVDGFSDGLGPSSAELLGRKDIGPEAVEYLLHMLAGKAITIVDGGARPGDVPGRRYAYVFLPDKTLVNTDLIKRGFGYADRQASHPRSREFLAIEEAARRDRAGVWAL